MCCWVMVYGHPRVMTFWNPYYSSAVLWIKMLTLNFTWKYMMMTHVKDAFFYPEKKYICLLQCFMANSFIVCLLQVMVWCSFLN